MKRVNMISKIALSLVLSVVFLLSASANSNDPFKERVNLALRQTGHQLLLIKKDSTSTIPPIEYVGDNGYLLLLQTQFNYDTLPYILDNALSQFDIEDSYHILIKSCEGDVPFLGFNKSSFQNKNVACVGRDQVETCANVYLEFHKKETSVLSTSTLWLFLIPIFAGLGYWVLNSKKILPSENNTTNFIQIGGYQFDPKNHLLVSGDEEINLTFRENKLLLLFAKQPNEILNRSDILSAVWEDEGVIVGRSLDVFISRLRKLLKNDPSIQIKNIHGVGYRLEV